jgi:MFS superfamily sulfate permease-like transporter
LFGFKGSHGDFWESTAHFIRHVGDTNSASITVGVIALVVLIAGKIWFPSQPFSFYVIVGGIAATSLADLEARGISVLGSVPQGLPALSAPAIRWTDLNELLPLAMACFLLGSVETVAIGRMFGSKHNYKIDGNQEFLAIAAGNLAAGIGHGFPVSGGMSQSLLNEGSGSKSPLSQPIAGSVVLLVVLFLTNLLHDLPQPILAAIVVMAAAGLFKLKALKRLWKFNRAEFFVAIAAMLGVLGSGVLRGVLIGAILSIIVLLRRASRPAVVVLGRVPGTHYFGDIERDPENELLPGILVFRVDSSLLYFNCDYIRDQVNELIASNATPVKLAVWCLGTTPAVDLAGADLVDEMREDLQRRGITLVLAEARGQVRDALRAAGLEEHFGPIVSNMAIGSTIKEWQSKASAA